LTGAIIPANLGPGVLAGFTTAGLDLATSQARLDLATWLGHPTVFADQVHGTKLAWVTTPPTGLVDDAGQADALATAKSGVVVAIRTADCVPVLLANPEAGLAAAIHAGWRGVLGGIVGLTVAALAGEFAAPSGFRAVIGPAICGRCYEVSPELVDRFERAGLPGGVTRAGTPGLDLPALVAGQLAAAGVGQVERVDRCTMEDQTLYSFRRQGGAAGRQCGYVALAQATPNQA
jgi:YfiH family protein